MMTSVRVHWRLDVRHGSPPAGNHGAMARRAARIALALLFVQGLLIGAWAAASPRSFYDDFPGGGRAWVAADGPYNEHLVRDFGDLNLALAAVTVVALVAFTRWVVLAAALGWIVYQTPHLIYHLRHLDLYDTSDKVANVTALVLALILPIVVLFGARRLRPGLGAAPSHRGPGDGARGLR
jgi:heme/copper-type cytochrome/quinol oxidase subunit 4